MVHNNVFVCYRIICIGSYLIIFFRIFIWIEKRIFLIIYVRQQFFLDIQTEKNPVVVLESHFGWWNYWLSGWHIQEMFDEVYWMESRSSFFQQKGRRGEEAPGLYIYDRSKIQKLFIHDCIIGIVQNSIVKWKYGWQVLELHRSCSSRDDDRQHGAVNAGHLKRYILPLWLQPAPSRESFSNFPYVGT